jgi:hypothetical protein
MMEDFGMRREKLPWQTSPNARQEIKMFWGNADAVSESSGPAVFSEANGYLSVWHVNEADPILNVAVL